MKISIEKQIHSKANVNIIPMFEDKLKENLCSEGHTTFNYVIKNDKFKASFGEVYYYTRESEKEIKNTFLLGLGKESDITAERIRKAVSRAIKKAENLKENAAHISLINTEKLSVEEIVKATFEGACFATYKFDKYKTDKKEDIRIEEIVINGVTEDKYEIAKEAVKEAGILIEATLMARDLVNEPANVIYPETLAKKVNKISKDSDFEVKIYDKSEIEKLDMKAFLEVTKGSEKEPKLIVMKYFGDKENKDDILGLVGKGLTYDAGGYSIKTKDGMITMKCDMGGSASVIGAVMAAAKMKLKANVVGVVAACENMISGGAYKPGDIIGSMAGKTIEILSTDAEGRLTLIDAVNYIIENEKAKKVVDIATLTGAAVSALGNTTTAVVTNNDEFYNELKKASEASGEKVWQLPSFDEYKELVKSDIADLKNSTGRTAGTITAGLFIGEFVKDRPWLHLDIAGTAWSNSNKDYLTKGGTGAGVRTLYYLIKEECK